MDEASIIASVREFITENFLYMHDGFVLEEEDLFLERGILDSMAVMELVSYLRAEYSLKVPERDVLEANLGSLKAIATYVLVRKEGARS